MKLTFVIVGTLIEFSMIAEPYDSYTELSKMTYQSNEYEVKLYSQTDTEMLFHLYLVPNDNSSIGWAYQSYYTGEIDLSTPIANMVKGNKHQLRVQLNQAIKDENYELCAKLRDKINEL